jgi:predicted PurR-regulated permease PerM
VHRNSAVIRVPLWMLVVVLAVVMVRVIPLPYKHIFIVVFTAILLASAIAPAATTLERYHVPRGVSILLAYLSVVAILVGVVALFVPLVLSEITTLQSKLPSYERSLNDLLQRVTPPGKSPLSSDELFTRLSGNLNDIAARLGRAVFEIAGILVQLLVILVAAYFLAVDPKFAERLVTRFAPARQRERTLLILRRIGTRMGHWVRAQLVLALFFGIAFGVGLAVLRVPYALTLGVAGGVLELIPYVGGFVTLVLACVVALTDDPIKVVGVIVIYTIVTNLEAHVVAPSVMGRILGLHPLTVVLALFIGTETLGILGALLSVPFAVVIQVITDELYVSREEEEKAAAGALESVESEELEKAKQRLKAGSRR